MKSKIYKALWLPEELAIEIKLEAIKKNLTIIEYIKSLMEK